jgi:PEP-CTERM motif
MFKTTFKALAVAAALSCGSAFAAPCTGVSVGSAQTTDVTFAGLASDACDISFVNPQQGANGNTSGFSGDFGGGWSLLGKVTGSEGSNILDGVTFTWGFEQTSGTTGTWTLETDQNVTLDLVFAMHASNRSGAFLFDDQSVFAETPGTWSIHWVNNGGQVPNFSNLTLFARDMTVTAVPEPETYALFAAGLTFVGWASRRRRRQQ